MSLTPLHLGAEIMVLPISYYRNLEGDARRALEEAQSQSFNALIKAWDAENDRALKALAQINKREAKEASEMAAIAASVELSLRGILLQAEGDPDGVSISIPTGVRIASPLGGTSNGEIAALISQIKLEDSDDMPGEQKSALWAVQNGFLPHPLDLSQLLQKQGVDLDWAKGLSDLGIRMDIADQNRAAHAGVQFHASHQKANALQMEVALLGALGDRALLLLNNPSALKKSGEPFPGLDALRRPGTQTKVEVLDRILDELI